MAFNTGNPIGSTDPRDFSDNSENLDQAVNDLTSPTWVDRFGNTRTTIAGQIGYIGTGVDGAIESYTSGLVLTTYSTIILYSGEFYRPSASATLPYTTTATTPDIDPNLVAVGDAVLRQDLAGNLSDGEGAALVNGATIYVGSVAELEGLSLAVGTNVYLTEDGRAGPGVIKSGTPPSDPQKGVNIVLADGNYWMRQYDSLSADGGLNVKWFGAKGDGVTDDTTAIQAAIDYSYGNILGFPKGEYISNELSITKAITIHGSLRPLDPVSYANDESRINFSLVAAGRYGLTIGGGTDEMIGFSMKNMAFRGTSANNGMDLAGTLTEDIKDSQFENCYWFNFNVGTRQSYLISGEFRNCRWQSCTDGIDSGNQCNAVLYSKCSITTISNLAFKASNNEGVHFDTCNISNLTRANSPITTFQSSVIFTNGYFENVTSDTLIQVGSSSEVAGLESKVIFIQPLKMGGNILVLKAGAYAEVIGGCRDDINIVTDGRTNVVSGVVHGQNTKLTPDSYVEIYRANDYPDFRTYQSASFTYDQFRGFYRVNNSGSAATGAYISRSLVAGEVYTLSFAAKIPTGSTASLAIRNGGTLLGLGLPDEGEDVEVFNIPLTAETSDLIFQWSGDIDFYGYTIQKGNPREIDSTIFATPSSGFSPITTTGVQAPVSGTWKRGDRVYDVDPSAGGTVGWVCVSDGSPGTWKTFGAITA